MGCERFGEGKMNRLVTLLSLLAIGVLLFAFAIRKGSVTELVTGIAIGTIIMNILIRIWK